MYIRKIKKYTWWIKMNIYKINYNITTRVLFFYFMYLQKRPNEQLLLWNGSSLYIFSSFKNDCIQGVGER